MTTKRLAVRLAAEGGRAVKAELQGVGDVGEKSFARIDARAKAMSRAMIRAFAAPLAAMATLAGAFKLIGDGTTEIDRVAKSARRLGTSISGFRAMELAAGEAGVSLSSLTDSVQTMDREIARGSTNAVAALTRLGLSARDLEGLDADQKLALIADRIKGLGLSTGETSALLQDLGVRNRETVLALLSGGDAFRSARSDIEDYGLAVSDVDASAIEAANDAIGRLSLVWKYLSQELAIAVVPALGALANALTDSLRAGGQLRAIIDGLVATVSAAVSAFRALYDAYRWVFNIVPTLNQLRRATDALTESISDEIEQVVILTGELTSGMYMSRDLALQKLEQARAHLATVDAMREERAALVESSDEYRQLSRTINGALIELEDHAADIRTNESLGLFGEEYLQRTAEDIEFVKQQLDSARERQAAMIAEASEMSPEYIEAKAEIERLEAAIAAAEGGVVRLGTETSRAGNEAETLARTAGQISFDAATASASRLAEQLGISVRLAQTLARSGAGQGDGGEVVFDPRDPRYDPEAARRARLAITMQELRDNAGTVSPFDPVRQAATASTEALNKAGSAGGAAGRAIAEAAEEAATGWARVNESLGNYADKAMDITTGIGDWLVSAFQSAESAFRDFANGGKVSFKEMVRSMIADLATLVFKSSILGPIAKALGGALGGGGFSLANIFHSGGMVGAGGPQRMVPALAFAGAPRMHDGGWAGLRPDEVPAILQRGERVLSRREVAQGGGTRADQVNINVNVEGANGDRHVIDLVRQGVQAGLGVYDVQLPSRVRQINANPRGR